MWGWACPLMGKPSASLRGQSHSGFLPNVQVNQKLGEAVSPGHQWPYLGPQPGQQRPGGRPVAEPEEQGLLCSWVGTCVSGLSVSRFGFACTCDVYTAVCIQVCAMHVPTCPLYVCHVCLCVFGVCMHVSGQTCAWVSCTGLGLEAP